MLQASGCAASTLLTIMTIFAIAYNAAANFINGDSPRAEAYLGFSAEQYFELISCPLKWSPEDKWASGVDHARKLISIFGRKHADPQLFHLYNVARGFLSPLEPSLPGPAGPSLHLGN